MTDDQRKPSPAAGVYKTAISSLHWRASQAAHLANEIARDAEEMIEELRLDHRIERVRAETFEAAIRRVLDSYDAGHEGRSPRFTMTDREILLTLQHALISVPDGTRDRG